MKYDFIDDFLLSKKGVTKDFQADWNWIRYKVDDKMFVAVCLDDNDKPVYITLKLNPIDGEFFRNSYEDIIPGYYMNKTHWNSIKADGNGPDDVGQIIVVDVVGQTAGIAGARLDDGNVARNLYRHERGYIAFLDRCLASREHFVLDVVAVGDDVHVTAHIGGDFRDF